MAFRQQRDILDSERARVHQGVQQCDGPVAGLMPAEVLAALKPEAVVPAMLVLAHESAPTRTILCAGAGTFEAAHITLTQGLHLGVAADTPEQLAAQLAQVTDRNGEQVPQSGAAQGTNEVTKAMAARG